MNLYIFNESSRASVYGIGTYLRELTEALRNSQVNICLIHLKSDKPEIQMEEKDGIRYWYFPAPTHEPRTTSQNKQNKLYYRNVVYLLQLYIEDTKDLIFHFNYNQSNKLADELKKVFDCTIVTVVHYSNWGFSVYDNLPRLRTILSEEHPDSFGEYLKKSLEEEKALYAKVDHVICLSNYMQEILCTDYAIDTAKISVISNGLTDMAKAKLNNKILRKKWNMSASEKIILFVGRMDEIKGLAYLINAFRKVLNTYPKCRLVVAGNGNYNTYTKESLDICILSSVNI